MRDRVQRLGPSAYYGRRTFDYETAEFHLAESTYAARASLPFHAHANAHFCLVLSGRYVERLSGDEVERRPGDLMFYRASAAHGEHHRRAGRHFLLELAPALARRLGSAAQTARLGVGPARSLVTRLYGSFRGCGETDSSSLDSLVRSLVDTFEVGRPPVPSWLARVEKRLRVTGSGGPDLAVLARLAGVHPVYLGRAFRQAFGCSPGEYLRRLRVSRAQRALAAEGVRIAEVAYAAGFCDQSHMNRVFKEQTGLTPGRFRALVSPS